MVLAAKGIASSCAAGHHFVLNLPNCRKNVALDCTRQFGKRFLEYSLLLNDGVDPHLLFLVFLINEVNGGKRFFAFYIQLDYLLLTGFET
jgi:hypothetical protein